MFPEVFSDILVLGFSEIFSGILVVRFSGLFSDVGREEKFAKGKIIRCPPSTRKDIPKPRGSQGSTVENSVFKNECFSCNQ